MSDPDAYTYRLQCCELPVLDGAMPVKRLPGEEFVAMCPMPSGKHQKYPGLEVRRVAILWRRPKEAK